MIEHMAFMVADPEAAVAWYCEYLGLREVRRGGGGDIFVSDETGQVVLQLEDARLVPGEKEEPGYGSRDARVLHLAFSVEDVVGEQKRLIQAGAKAEGDVLVTVDGDEMALLRDPWGLAFQLVKRKDALR